MIPRSIRTIAALLSIAFLLPACRGPVLGMLGRQVESAMRANLPAELPDGLHVLLCGAGGPMPDPKRSGPCVAIIAGESVVMIGSGSGAARNLARFGLQPGLVEAVAEASKGIYERAAEPYDADDLAELDARFFGVWDEAHARN